MINTLPLDQTHHIQIAKLPPQFAWSEDNFQKIWHLHPEDFHIFELDGQKITTPRWQQAYGKSFRYPGSKEAIPIPAILKPYHDWVKQHINPELNSLLLNWYEGKFNHFIRPHRDHTDDLVPDSQIVTISLGEERVFRMTSLDGQIQKDFIVGHGDALVIPWETNLHWTHEVPLMPIYQGRRISITLRAVKNE